MKKEPKEIKYERDMGDNVSQDTLNHLNRVQVIVYEDLGLRIAKSD